MGIKFTKINEKPINWPSNELEAFLDIIHDKLVCFKMNPSYKNKEELSSLVSDYDLNQKSMLGLHRTTKYEVSLMNLLFLEATLLSFKSLKTYLYEIVGEKAISQKTISSLPMSSEPLEIEEFKGLLPQLKLYYISYLYYRVDKDMSFAEKLIQIVNNSLEHFKTNYDKGKYNDSVDGITKDFTLLLNDISYFNCVKRVREWAFTREEIYKLFDLAAKLIDLNDDSPIKRPMKGVLKTSISNYVLKSRNNYNEDYIYKYIQSNVAKISVSNHEVWMSIIQNLNDDREQKIIPELFNGGDWINYSWAKNIDFTPTRKYFVSSFSKSKNNSELTKTYGTCIYGFKNDSITEILSPIHFKCGEDRVSNTPVFTQIMAFDVIYNQEEAKNEINFLCRILDRFNMTELEKKNIIRGNFTILDTICERQKMVI